MNKKDKKLIAAMLTQKKLKRYYYKRKQRIFSVRQQKRKIRFDEKTCN
jgi:hypothetical protein